MKKDISEVKERLEIKKWKRKNNENFKKQKRQRYKNRIQQKLNNCH